MISSVTLLIKSRILSVIQITLAQYWMIFIPILKGHSHKQLFWNIKTWKMVFQDKKIDYLVKNILMERNSSSGWMTRTISWKHIYSAVGVFTAFFMVKKSGRPNLFFLWRTLLFFRRHYHSRKVVYVLECQKSAVLLSVSSLSSYYYRCKNKGSINGNDERYDQ